MFTKKKNGFSNRKDPLGRSIRERELTHGEDVITKESETQQWYASCACGWEARGETCSLVMDLLDEHINEQTGGQR